MSKTYINSLRLIKGRIALVKMASENNELEYTERENISPDSSPYNSSGNSNKYYPDLTNSMSELDNSFNYEKTSNTLIKSEQGRIRGVVKGRSMATDESNTLIGREQRKTEFQPNPKDDNLYLEDEHRDRQTLSNNVPRHRVRQPSLPVRNVSPKSQPKPVLEANTATLPAIEWNWFFTFVGLGVVIIIGAVLVGLVTFWIFAWSELAEHQTPNQPVVCSEFLKMEEEYPYQSAKLWIFLKSGVERVTNKKPTKPSVFMLVHEYDVDITDILKKFVKITQKCLGTQSNTAVHLTPTTLTKPEYLSDYGRVISDYKSALSASGIMIVRDFDKVPAYVAQAFHTICDCETPYVARSVIFLTMSVEKQISKEDNPFKIAEEKLTSLWNSLLKGNVLGPLLYRVTDVTLHIDREM